MDCDQKQFADYLDQYSKCSEHAYVFEAVKGVYSALCEAAVKLRKRDAKNFFWALFNHKKANGTYGVPAGYEGANIQDELDNLFRVIQEAPATFGDRIGYAKSVFPEMAATFGMNVNTMTDQDLRMKQLIAEFWDRRRAGTLSRDSHMLDLFSYLNDPALRSHAGKYASFIKSTLEFIIYDGMSEQAFIQNILNKPTGDFRFKVDDQDSDDTDGSNYVDGIYLHGILQDRLGFDLIDVVGMSATEFKSKILERLSIHPNNGFGIPVVVDGFSGPCLLYVWSCAYPNGYQRLRGFVVAKADTNAVEFAKKKFYRGDDTI